MIPLGLLGYLLTDRLSSGEGGSQLQPPRVVVRTVTVTAPAPTQPAAVVPTDGGGKGKGHHGNHGKNGKDD